MLGHTRWASVGIISEANAHPLEPARSSTAPTVPTSSARSTATSTTTPTSRRSSACRSRRDHHRRQGHPHARRPAHRTRARPSTTRSAPRSPRSRARSRIAAQTAAAPDQLLLVAARQRPGALRRPGRGRLRRRQRAVRPGRGDRHLPAPRRRDPGRSRARRRRPAARSWCSTPRSAGTLDGIRRFAYDGTPLPVDADELAARRDHDARHRPRRVPALPAEGDLGGAGVVPQDAARQDRRARRPPRGRRSARRRCPTRCAPGCAPARIRRVVVIGQGTAASRARASRPRSPRLADDRRAAPTRCVATELSRVPARATTCPTRSSSRSARAAPPPTPTAPSTSCARAAPRSSRSSTGATATSSTSPTACSTRPTVATSRWRAVHQGVLRADRRRVPARARDRRRGRHPRLRRACTELLDALRDAPRRDARGARRSAPRSPASRSGTRCRGATGRSSATAATASPPHEVRIKLSELCYKSIACDATEDKKHIDLSAEPLILVCAAGLQGSNADDVAKEIAIYRAHRAAPIVIADRGRAPLRRRARDDRGPRGASRRRASCCRRWPVTSSATRPRSPSTRRPGRCARPAPRSQAVVSAADPGDDPAASRSDPQLELPGGHVPRRPARRLLRRPPRGRHRGADRVAAALRDRARAPRRVPGRARQGRDAQPRGRGPHRRAHRRHRGAHPPGRRDQAPGQDGHRRASRVPTRRCCRSPLVREVLAAGAARDALSYRALRTLVALDPAVEEVIGFTRYRIEGDVDGRRRDDPRRRPRRHLGRPPVAHRRRPPPARHQAPGRRPSARSPSHAAAATAARW